MPSASRRLWNKYLRPQVQKFGFDVRRYPPQPAPGWTETAFDSLLARRASGRADQSDPAQLFLSYCIQHLAESSSQLLQDLFVRWQFNRWQLEDVTPGFFVEFGAANGIDLSNSIALERLGWRGILAEPARCWQAQLKRNRVSAIDTRCVWARTGEVLEFNETASPEFSTLESFSRKDHHADARAIGTAYPVETVSLNDLLADHDAPRTIDYLSIDTEGSELPILAAFDFKKYDVRMITVEHNFTADRAGLLRLLSGHGFERVFSEFSKQDDWYVKSGT
jgi:FkbM family methyltransferase